MSQALITAEGIKIDSVLKLAFPSEAINLADAVAGAVNDIFVKPNTNEALLQKVSASSVKVPEGFIVKVNGSIIQNMSDTILDLNTDLDTGAKVAGTDYYVYALETGSFILSANNSFPSGYTALNSRKIGGFHYGVIPENFTAINNISASDATTISGINAYSCWDLKWRPISSPEGMAYVGGFWVDIYLLNSEHIINGTSKAGAIIAAGDVTNGRAIPKIPLSKGGDGSATYGTLTWLESVEIAKSHSKRLLSYAEFTHVAFGVKEASSADTLDDGSIQHLADYTSKFGLCQATGVQYVWGADLSALATSGAWQSVTDGRGDIYANSNELNAVGLGGYRSSASNSGSRCSDWSSYVWDSNWSIGTRFACDHLKLV